jgi:hypothetical protein
MSVEVRGAFGRLTVSDLENDPEFVVDCPYPPEEFQLMVRAQSGWFMGEAFPFMNAENLRTFATELEALAARHAGAATLVGVHEGALRLRVAWEPSAGGGVGLVVTGRITCPADRIEVGGPHLNVLEFAIDFPRDQLPGVVAGFRAMAEGRTEPGAAADRPRDTC